MCVIFFPPSFFCPFSNLLHFSLFPNGCLRSNQIGEFTLPSVSSSLMSLPRLVAGHTLLFCAWNDRVNNFWLLLSEHCFCLCFFGGLYRERDYRGNNVPTNAWIQTVVIFRYQKVCLFSLLIYHFNSNLTVFVLGFGLDIESKRDWMSVSFVSSKGKVNHLSLSKLIDSDCFYC